MDNVYEHTRHSRLLLFCREAAASLKALRVVLVSFASKASYLWTTLWTNANSFGMILEPYLALSHSNFQISIRQWFHGFRLEYMKEAASFPGVVCNRSKHPTKDISTSISEFSHTSHPLMARHIQVPAQQKEQRQICPQRSLRILSYILHFVIWSPQKQTPVQQGERQ